MHGQQNIIKIIGTVISIRMSEHKPFTLDQTEERTTIY